MKTNDATNESTSEAAIAGFLDLPDHIIVEDIIAELFPTLLFCDDGAKAKDLRDILSFASTCTRIHELASHPSLWRNVNAAVFCESFVSNHVRLPSSFRLPSLPLGAVHCEVFRHSPSCAQPCILLLESLTELTDVRVPFRHLRLTSGLRLASSITSLQFLRSLDIDDSKSSRCIAGKRFSDSLRSLRIAGPCGVAGITAVPFSAGCFTSVTEFSVGSTCFTDEWLSALAAACPNVTSLSLRWIGECRATDLTPIFFGCRSLCRLSLSVDRGDFSLLRIRTTAVTVRDMSIISRGGKAVSEVARLALFPNTETLRIIGDFELTDSDTVAIGAMHNLRSLTLDGCFFEGDPNRFLNHANAHENVHANRLSALVLKGIRDCDVTEFISSPFCSSLVELVVDGCRVRTDALVVIAKASTVSLCNTLQRLVLANPAVSHGTKRLTDDDRCLVQSFLSKCTLLCEVEIDRVFIGM